MLIFPILTVSALIILNISAALKFRRVVSGMPSIPSEIGDSQVPISVIIACKGDDGRLLENLETLVNQDYSAAEFVLVTALAEDPAQTVFGQLRAANPGRRIKTVVAGISPYGSEKNNNLIKALAATDPASEILVFLDSDGKSDRHLIRKLVSGLQGSSFAGVSGYRWYQPRWGVLPEMLRTVWNAGGYCYLVQPQTAFVWAGAMAFRRKTFEEAGIPELWAKSLSTDSPLRLRLNALGLETQFLPNCIVLSSERDGWRSLFHFTSRHTLLARIFQKRFFAILFLENVIGNFFGLGLFICGLTRGIPGGGLAIGLVGILWIVHLWLYGWLITGPIQQMLKASGIDVKLKKGLLMIVAPLAGLLEAYCVIYSLFVKRVKWAGVTYEIEGQTVKRL